MLRWAPSNRRTSVLVEQKNVRQIRGEGYRRWFSDDYFDLILWCDPPCREPADIIGFQLCYDRGGRERALTWTRARGYSHEQVDTGESQPGGMKASPILVADGLFDSAGVGGRFREAARNLEPSLTEFVLEKLAAYPGPLF
jgi:hypothetical protein